MTLKSRFFIVTVTTILAVAAAIIIANFQTIRLHEERLLATEINSKYGIWREIVLNELDRLQSQYPSFTRYPDLFAAIKQGDSSAAMEAVASIYDRLWHLDIASRLQVMDAQGRILVALKPDTTEEEERRKRMEGIYASTPVAESFPSSIDANVKLKALDRSELPITNKRVVYTAIKEGRNVRGIERDDDGALAAFVAIPLIEKGKVIGVAVLGRNLTGMMHRFMEHIGSLAFIADEGWLIGLPVESNILPDVSALIPEVGKDFYSVERLHGRTYQVTIMSIGDFEGKPISHMAVFRDYTEGFAEERTANVTGFAIIILMLVASVAWLYWFVVMESHRLHESDQKVNRELAVTNAKLQEAVRVKSDFLANMSHELRTPLNSVIGFSGGLLKGIDGPLNDDQSQSLTLVYSSGQHLLALINDVLDISKIEAGKMVLNLETVDLRRLLDQTVKTVEVLFRNKGLPLRVELGDSIPIVYGDNTRIKQVLLNMLSNAAKFTDRGDVVVRCRVVPTNDATIPLLERQTTDGQTHWVLISVKDSGIGIKDSDHHKVFEEFRQIDSGTNRKYGGTGLGMAISKRIVELHGGRIWLNSRIGKGTTFHVALPHTGDSQFAEGLYCPVDDYGPVFQSQLSRAAGGG